MIAGPDDGLPQSDEVWCCGCDIPAHRDAEDAAACQGVKNAILLATFEDTDRHTPFAAARRIGDADLYIRGVGVVSPPPGYDFEGATSDEMAGMIRDVILARRDPVTLAMELPTATGPTPRRSAWNALESMHQRTILDEVGTILADVRHKSWMSLAEARDKILAAVLD